MTASALATDSPRIIDRSYILHEQLGEGGMGAVFRATQRGSGRTVALKVIGSRGSTGQGTDSRTQSLLALAREFQTLSSLHHPNVIQVLDYGFDEAAGPYFTMELLSSPLGLLAAGLGKSLDVKVDLLTQFLRALAYMHRRGVIHRDLKPSNVLCVRGQVKVLDFGLATTEPSAEQVAGTLEYMAPELFAGVTPSVRSDLYAFGVIAEQLLLGERLRSDESLVLAEQAVTLAEGDARRQTTPIVARRSPSVAPKDAPTEEPSMPSAEEVPTAQVVRPERRGTSTTKPRGASAEGASSTAQYVRDLLSKRASRASSSPPAMSLSEGTSLSPVADAFAQIVQRLCSPRPQDRYGSADEVLADLGRAIGKELPLETEATRESFLQASEFVGREAELAKLKEALAAAMRGNGSAWLVGGESGVGKSRLISELRTLALVQGAYVVQGQAVAEGGRSYEVWLSVLRSLCLREAPPDAEAAVLRELLPDLSELLERPLPDPPKVAPAAAEARLAVTIDASFRRQTKPTVVILEDLQWAKEDSITLFGRMAAHAAELPLLLLGNYRDDEAPQLPASLPAAYAMKLERLGKSQIARLSASMLGHAGEQPEIIEYLCRETEGNIFFLVEVVRALAEQSGELARIGKGPLPEQLVTGGIEKILRRRIDRVPPSDRALLDAAATLGRRLDIAVLRLLAQEIDVDQWLVTCANGAILESQGGEWQFSHDKLREAILSSIPADRWRALHGDIVRALEAVYTGADRDARSAALAHYAERAGDLERASRYHARAGEMATRLCSYGQARRHHAAALTALAALPDTNDNRRLEVDTLLMQVYTTMVADPTEQNMARMVEATSLLSAIAASEGGFGREDQLRMARVNNVIGRIHFYKGQAREALEYFQKVLPVAEETQDDELLSLSSCLIGTALLTQGDMRRAEPLLAQATGPLERLGEPFEWFRAVGYRGLSLVALGRYREGLAELERVHVRARSIGQPSLSSAAHLMRSTALALAAEWPRVIDDGHEVVRLASQTGDKLHLSLAWSNLGWANSNLGRHQLAIECRARAAEQAQAMGGRLVMADWYVAADAEIAFNAGRHDEALSTARAVAESSRAASLLLSHGIAERVWGAVLGRAGDGAASDQHMGTSVLVLEGAGLALPAARTRLWWAIELRARGDVDAAERLFEEALEVFVQAGSIYAQAEAERRWYAPSSPMPLEKR